MFFVFQVDGDRKNPLPSGVQDSMSTVGTHATLLSSGAGYMAFAYVFLTASYLLIYYEFLSCFYCLLNRAW